MINPLIEVWDSPFGSPPFDRIKISHYKQAVRRSIRKAITEIKNIAGNPEPPDFRNTIEAIEKAGADLGRVTPVLFNLNSAETSKQLQETTQVVSPLLTKFSNDITLNRKLFKRIKEVYEKRESSFLDAEQRMLTEKNKVLIGII